MSLGVVLYLQARSESLKYRSYFERIGSESLLEWLIGPLPRLVPEASFYIICDNASDQARAVEVLRSRNVTVFRSQCSSQLLNLAELVKATKASRLALVPMGLGLAPTSLLQRVGAHHASQKNDFTEVKGLPRGTTPAMFNSGTLLALSDFQVPGANTDPISLVRALKSLKVTTGQEAPLPLNSVPFDASSVYQLDPVTLPRSIRIETPNDVDVLRRVCLRLGAREGEERGILGLRLWKQEAMCDARRRRTELKSLALSKQRRVQRSDSRSILYVSNASAFSGAEESLCQLVTQVDAERFKKFALVALEGHFTERLRQAGALVVCPEQDFATNTLDNFFYTLSVLRRIRPSIVHLNSPSGLPILCGASLIGAPVVFHARTVPAEPYAEFLESVDAIIAVSNFIKGEVLQFGVPESNVRVIYDGVDTVHFRPGLLKTSEAREAFGIPQDAKVALMIARLAPNKRHDVMLRAAGAVKPHLPSFHLVVVGEAYESLDRQYSDMVRREASALGLAECISWLGFVPDIRAVEAAADVLVLCSEREPLGTSVMEAMAMELPVVVSDDGGSHEMVKHGERGFVIKAGDAGSLAKHLLMLLTSEDLCNSFGRAARSYVESNLTARASAQRVMEIYDGLTATTNPSFQKLHRPRGESCS